MYHFVKITKFFENESNHSRRALHTDNQSIS